MAYRNPNQLTLRKGFKFYAKKVESKSYSNGIYYKFLISKRTEMGNWLNANITWFPKNDRENLENGDSIQINEITSISFTESQQSGNVYMDIVAECEIINKSQKEDTPSFVTDINSFSFNNNKESDSLGAFQTDSFDAFNIDDDFGDANDDDIEF